MFYNIESFDLKSAFLFALVDVVNKSRVYSKKSNEPRRHKTRIFYLQNKDGNKMKVCKTFFKGVLKVSDGRMSRVVANKIKAMSAPLDRRGKQPSANKTPDHKVDQVKKCIEKFPSNQSH